VPVAAKQTRIRVNDVAPAVVVTPICGTFIDEDKIEETLQGNGACDQDNL